MNAPATVDAFLDLVRKSGIVDDKRLAAYLERERTTLLPTDPHKLAERLVQDGLLTHFQAEQFLQGKCRRFTIGNYKVLERIGAGGMGIVFLCEHKFMRRRAAVKILPTAQSNDPSALQRFYREARAVAALDHPNIVRAYDIDQEDNLHFLVMEYVDGSSLQEVVHRVGRLDPIRAAHYISQAALGLQHAHEAAGLVHRDIKPGNIIVDRNGVVKVLDLGLARFFYDEEDLLTKKLDENVLGTADYLAPEQALDSHSVDIRGDIYSLGGTFYFCLTGQPPFAEGEVAHKLMWHQTRQPKPIFVFRPDVPEHMIAVVNKMMAKDPKERYQTPLEVAEALQIWTQISIAPPAEIEMPRLSRAAASRIGLSDTSSASGPQGSHTRKVWQVPASSTTPRNVGSSSPSAKPPGAVPDSCAAKAREAKPLGKLSAPLLPAELTLSEPPDDEAAGSPAPVAPPIQQEEASPCVDLAPDTETFAAKVDTTPTRPKKAATHRPSRAKALARIKQRQRQRIWLWGGVAGAASCVVLGVLVWVVASSGKQQVVEQPTAPPALFVSHSARGNAFRTVGEAIQQAKDRDHIVVLDDIEEQLDLTSLKKELVIETSPGKSVVWRFPRSFASAKELLWLNGVGNLTIQGITFDGLNRVDQIMRITGHSPGLTLEDIHLRGFRNYAILVVNAAGTNERPVALVRLKAPTAEKKEAALAFAQINQHIQVCDPRFDGPYKTPVLLMGDPSGIKFIQNGPTVLIHQPR
jgi:serine/threonine protein kinase